MKQYGLISVFFSLILSAAALAVPTLSLDRNQFSLGSCASPSTVTLTVSTTPPEIQTTSGIALFVTLPAPSATPSDPAGAAATSCPPKPLGGRNSQLISTLNQNPANLYNFTYTFNSNDLIGLDCSGAGAAKSWLLCLYSTTSNNNADAPIAGVAFSYDTSVATATIGDIATDSGAISFKVNTSKTGISTYNTCYGKKSIGNIDADGCPAGFSSRDSTTAQVSITDLENFAEYSFKVRLTESSGSVGPWSASATATPYPVTTALGKVQAEGLPANPVSVSCQSSGVVPFALLAYLLRFSRRRGALSMSAQVLKKSSYGFFLCALMIFASPVFSEAGQVSVGLQISPYIPNLNLSKKVDGTPLSTPIYQDFFWGTWLPLGGLDVNAHLTDAYGSLQLGASAVYTLATGSGRRVEANGNIDLNTPSTNLGLHILMLRPHLTYIFNPYMDYFPLAPFVRVGIVGAGYYFTKNGSADTTAVSGDNPQNPLGARFGYELAGGLYFLMDILEPNAASSARAHGVYQHTYLRFEIAYMPVDNFGSPGLDFSPTGLLGSALPLMVTGALVIEF